MLANIFATMLAKVPEERTWYFKMIGNDVTIYKFEAKKYRFGYEALPTSIQLAFAIMIACCVIIFGCLA
jgi:hypothetical protein